MWTDYTDYKDYTDYNVELTLHYVLEIYDSMDWFTYKLENNFLSIHKNLFIIVTYHVFDTWISYHNWWATKQHFMSVYLVTFKPIPSLNNINRQNYKYLSELVNSKMYKFYILYSLIWIYNNCYGKVLLGYCI